jgi:hypothetical protein
MTTPCKYFISYAHNDKKHVNDLLPRLKTQLKIVKNAQFSGWDDRNIVVGNHWKDEIDQAMEESDFGILMLSPNFFASDFIVEDELTHFLSQNNGNTQILKPIVPVGLKPINLDGSRDLKGVEKIQIFRDKNNRWFNETRGHTKDAFAEQLANQILRKPGVS